MVCSPNPKKEKRNETPQRVGPDMTPPRLKPCPACASPCPVQASVCRVCGQSWPRRKGGRPAPSLEARYGSALARRAHIDQGKRGPLPDLIPPRNISKKGAKVLAEIKRLAADGLNATEIAHIIGHSKTSVRRYAKDYGVKLILSEPGPSVDGKLQAQTAERVEACRLLLRNTTNVAEIAEALGIGKAAAREYMKRCRDVYGVELPGFDQRKASGFAVTRRRKS